MNKQARKNFKLPAHCLETWQDLKTITGKKSIRENYVFPLAFGSVKSRGQCVLLLFLNNSQL